MAKFDLHKTNGLHNVLNAVSQVKSVNNILPLTEAKELPIGQVYPSGENFYAVAELDELADSIRELGILQPLLVSEQSGGTYEIIAGNRRYEAAKMAGLERLPCVVKQNIDPSLFKIMLIHANMFRVKTDMERATEVAELKKAITDLKAAHKSIKGRTSEIAGQILNLSYRQVNRLDNLNRLIPEIQDMVREERLTASSAEQFANLEEDAQRELYKALISSGADISREEAVRLREAFQDQSREQEARAQAEKERLQAQLRQKEQELEALVSQSVQPAASADKKELDRVKQALAAAMRDRQDMEDRYNALSHTTDPPRGGAASAVDTEGLINDIKRRVHLQECIGQLKLASRTYTDYKNLYRFAAPAKPTAGEADLIDELVNGIRAFSKLVTTE